MVHELLTNGELMLVGGRAIDVLMNSLSELASSQTQAYENRNICGPVCSEISKLLKTFGQGLLIIPTDEFSDVQPLKCDGGKDVWLHDVRKSI